MRFLQPEFLFALFMVVIPVIIHLFNFRQYKKVYFSNVALLKRVSQQTTGARQLKRYLLLLCRVLTIVFLVFAFARPYIPSTVEGQAASQNVVSIYIDNSYSMEAINREGTLLDEAKRKAKEIAGSYAINDRFQLITNDFDGIHQRLMSRIDFTEAVDTIKISSMSRSFKQIINRQNLLFKGSAFLSTVTYLLSDFQNNMRDQNTMEKDTTSVFRLVRLKANKQANISVDSVWFLSPLHKSGGVEQLIVRLKNNSDTQAEQVSLKVLINEQQKAFASVEIAARGISLDTLKFSGLSNGWEEGRVEIADNPITFDDHYYFSFYVRKEIPLLVIYDHQKNSYIDAVYRSEPFFKVNTILQGNVDYSRLSEYPLIILSGVEEMTVGLAQQLNQYVRNGGDLVVFPSETNKLTGLQTLTTALGINRPVEVIRFRRKVNKIDVKNPLFKGVFKLLPRNISLPFALAYIRYPGNGRNLLELEDQIPFLSQHHVQQGTVYLSAVALNEKSSNLVRHSLFVPILFQFAFTSLNDQALSYTPGKDLYIEINPKGFNANQSLRLRNKDKEIIPDFRKTEKGRRLFISDQGMKSGIYRLTSGDSLLAKVAFNDNRSESDLSYLNDAELKKIFKSESLKLFEPGTKSLSSEIKAVNFGVQLWKLCLILSLVSVAAEILLLRYYRQMNIKN
ncbi:BatA domain-containing protein [Arcticibacter eurypsychrophilus]|uniref:BatA domain-containing protein n=1 Tax=Arcticibacter eurypsychrophilus TaxID=1434752 RepID=UPI00084E03EA|nr:BatA domain-containing protein [Arcticibacter eurypsychrophilus]